MVLQNTTLGFNVRRQKFAPEGGHEDDGPPQAPARGRYVNANAMRFLAL